MQLDLIILLQMLGKCWIEKLDPKEQVRYTKKIQDGQVPVLIAELDLLLLLQVVHRSSFWVSE